MAVRWLFEQAAARAHLISNGWLDGALEALESDSVAALVSNGFGKIIRMNGLARSILGPSAATIHVQYATSWLLQTFEQIVRSIVSDRSFAHGAKRRLILRIGSKFYTLEATNLLDRGV